MEAVLTVRLPPDVVDKVKQIAIVRNLTRSDVARTAITEFAQRNPV